MVQYGVLLRSTHLFGKPEALKVSLDSGFASRNAIVSCTSNLLQFSTTFPWSLLTLLGSLVVPGHVILRTGVM